MGLTLCALDCDDSGGGPRVYTSSSSSSSSRAREGRGVSLSLDAYMAEDDVKAVPESLRQLVVSKSREVLSRLIPGAVDSIVAWHIPHALRFGGSALANDCAKFRPNVLSASVDSSICKVMMIHEYSALQLIVLLTCCAVHAAQNLFICGADLSAGSGFLDELIGGWIGAHAALGIAYHMSHMLLTVL